MTHKRSSELHNDSDQWLALRYVSGELDEIEWTAFEQRLANDFALQVTLAETVKLTTRLTRMPRPSNRRPWLVGDRRARSRQRPVALGAVGLVAAALMAFGLLLQSTSSERDVFNVGDGSGVSADVASVDVPAIVAIWSALSGEDFAAVDQLAALDSTGLEILDQDHPALGDLDVPNWLLLAVHDEMDDSASSEFPGGEPL